ncbi:winged helix-turn-helix domain-containing protein, partial [Oceanicella sp. SM1341]|uniref:ATP-binding protein n=1 Tax=Oceanicella sp. SM1341 TaxID=1548889 RepID=UPI000E47D903
MEETLRFGPFALVPERRSLLRDGEVVALGSRALDVLLCLVATPGAVRSHQEIVAHVWPDTHVEGANLRVHVSGLRKALGDTRATPRYIANVPGRGYAFIAPVSRQGGGAAAPGGDGAPLPAPRLPGLPRVFGREQSVETVLAQLGKGRLVTLTGPGGIGKSTVARVVARRVAEAPRTEWIDLSEVTSGERVAATVATAFGVATRARDLCEALARAMEAEPTLVVLDNCEHVVEGVTTLVEGVLARSGRVCFLATSREPLRALGERVYRLPPLGTPEAGAPADAIAAAPAVQLFLERADASLGGYELTATDAPLVVEICNRLDGIALAIELAAGRLETMGLAALAGSLTDSFRVLSRGRRTALARHQTLRATLDWSYMLLEPAESRALRELSVFRGRFTGSAAEAVLSEDGADHLAALVAKSLVVLDTDGPDPFYRLLDTTRLYAHEKLVESGALRPAMLRLGLHLRGLLAAANTRLYAGTAGEVAAEYGHLVASLGACLDWCFAPGGDMLGGARLTGEALPLYFKLSLFDECIATVTASIRYLDANPDLDETLRMKLYTALGWPQLISADAPDRGVAAWNALARIAGRLGDTDHQLRATWALWVDAINRGQPRQGLALAGRFAALARASGTPGDALVARRMQAATLHWLGRHADAAAGLEAMLLDYEYLPEGGHSVRFHFDQGVTARIILARCRWFLGDEAGGLEEAAAALERAWSVRHLASVSNVLAEAACPLALMAGDAALASGYLAQLREHTRMVSLDVWNTYAECFEAGLVQRAGDHAAGLRQLRRNLEPLRRAGFVLFEPMFVATEARALCGLGRHAEGLAALDRALEDGRRSGACWWDAELHREKAAIHRCLAQEAPAAASLAAALHAAEATGARALARRAERDRAAAGPA